MSALSLWQWLHQQSNAPTTALMVAQHQRSVLDVSIAVMERMDTVRDASFATMILPNGELAQGFDLIYTTTTGDQVGALVVENSSALVFSSPMDVFVQQWAVLAMQQRSHQHLDRVEVWGPNATLLHQWDMADLVSVGALDESVCSSTSGSVVSIVSQESSQEELQSLAHALAIWRLVAQEADAASKKIEENLAQQFDARTFAADGVTFGIARSKINKTFLPNQVDAAVEKMMHSLHFGEADIDSYYTQNPNFTIPAKLDADLLADLLLHHLKIDVRTDPRFADAVAEPATPNINNRIEFLKDLAAQTGEMVDWDQLVDWDQTSIKTELTRESLSGPARQLRQTITASLRANIAPLIGPAGAEYTNARAHIAQAPQPPKRRRQK